MDSRYRFLTLGTPWTQSMPSRDINAVTRLAEASWWRDNGPECVSNKSYNEFITPTTYIWPIINWHFQWMDSRWRFLTLGIPWAHSMPSREVNAAMQLAEASWRRDNIRYCCCKIIKIKVYIADNLYLADNRHFQRIRGTVFWRRVYLGLQVCRHVTSMLRRDWLKLVEGVIMVRSASVTDLITNLSRRQLLFGR